VTCKRCGLEIPDNVVSTECPVCYKRRAHQSLLTREAHYAREIATGTVQLRLANDHLEFIFMAGQAYCGHPLSKTATRYRVDYRPDLEPHTCRACWKALQSLLKLVAA
jgi:hypothetical protein